MWGLSPSILRLLANKCAIYGYSTLPMIAGIGLRVKATMKATVQATAREGREGLQGGAERDGGLRFASDAAERKRDKEVGIPTTQD